MVNSFQMILLLTQYPVLDMGNLVLIQKFLQLVVQTGKHPKTARKQTAMK